MRAGNESVESAIEAFKRRGGVVTHLPDQPTPHRPSTGLAEREANAAVRAIVGSARDDHTLSPELREELSSVYGGRGRGGGRGPRNSRQRRGLIRGAAGGMVGYPV